MPFQNECTKYNLKSQCPKVQETITEYEPDLGKAVVEVDKMCTKCKSHLEWLKQHGQLAEAG